MNIAERIVETIIDDIQNRSGIGDEWDKIYPQFRADIRSVWINVVNDELEESICKLMKLL